MIPILNLSDLLILSILLKLDAVPFARIFRSNKYVQDVIQRSQEKLSSSKKPVNESLTFAMESSILTLRHETRPIAQKTFEFPARRYSVPKFLRETLCYFRFGALREHGLVRNNPLLPKVLKIEADILATSWSDVINKLLEVVRPKTLKLHVFDTEFKKYNHLDVKLLKTLEMDEISVRAGFLQTNHIHHLLNTVAPFTKRLQINVVSLGRPRVTKDYITALVKMVMDNKYGRFQHFKFVYPKITGLELDEELSPISSFKLAHNKYHDKFVAWTIPLSQGFIFVNKVCNDNTQLDVVVCSAYESLREWYRSHAKECTRNIAEIWERGNGRTFTCQRNIPTTVASPAGTAAPPQRAVHVNNRIKTISSIKKTCRRPGCFLDKNGRLRDKKGRFVKTK